MHRLSRSSLVPQSLLNVLHFRLHRQIGSHQTGSCTVYSTPQVSSSGLLALMFICRESQNSHPRREQCEFPCGSVMCMSGVRQFWEWDAAQGGELGHQQTHRLEQSTSFYTATTAPTRTNLNNNKSQSFLYLGEIITATTVQSRILLPNILTGYPGEHILNAASPLEKNE